MRTDDGGMGQSRSLERARATILPGGSGSAGGREVIGVKNKRQRWFHFDGLITGDTSTAQATGSEEEGRGGIGNGGSHRQHVLSQRIG